MTLSPVHRRVDRTARAPRDPRVAPAQVGGPLYPVGLVVRGRPCLVVGGGKVAARKVASLLACGAAVTMVAPDVREALGLLGIGGTGCTGEGLALDVQRRRYRRGEVAGYRLVIAATRDARVNAAVYKDAEAAGVWVNSADDPSRCSVSLPAVWRSGPVTVAVSTDGTSPALAGWLRTRLAACAGEHIGHLATLLGGARRRLQDEGRPTGSVDWRAVLEGPVEALVAQGRLDHAAAALSEALESAASRPRAVVSEEVEPRERRRRTF